MYNIWPKSNSSEVIVHKELPTLTVMGLQKNRTWNSNFFWYIGWNYSLAYFQIPKIWYLYCALQFVIFVGINHCNTDINHEMTGLVSMT